MEPIEFSPEQSNLWDQFVLEKSNGSLFETFRYRKVLERVYSLTAHYLGILDKGEVLGTLPLFECPSLHSGSTLVTLPYSGSFHALRAGDEVRKMKLVDAAVGLADRLGVRSLEIRDRSGSFRKLDRMSSDFKFSYDILDLNASSDEIWNLKIDSKVRNQVRKAEKSGILWSAQKVEGIEVFYQIYERTMRRLGSPAHSLQFFRELYAEFSNETSIGLASLGSTPVSALWLMRSGGAVINPWAGSDRDYATLCGNNLNYWKSISWAVESGAKEFHFGRSMAESSQSKFKAQWGVRSVPLEHHFYSPRGAVVEGINPNALSVKIFRKVWSRLPEFVSRRLGPTLASRVP